MQKLLLATRNPGKIREIKEILKDTKVDLISLDDIKYTDEIPETGKTFEENAIIKAKTIGEKTGLLTLAEDSGLEVDALGGRPGILSARYCEGTDLDRINKLLKELKGVPKEKRTARYRAVIALFIPFRHPESRFNRDEGSQSIPDGILHCVQNDKGKIFTFNGVCEGYITDKPIGVNGFGYDPIFFSLDLGKTNGEVTLKEKNQISHRARALKKLKKILLGK